MEHNTRKDLIRAEMIYLQSGIEALVVSELAHSYADLPFEDALATLQEGLELGTNALSRNTRSKEALVKGLLEVIARPLRYLLRLRPHIDLTISRELGWTAARVWLRFWKRIRCERSEQWDHCCQAALFWAGPEMVSSFMEFEVRPVNGRVFTQTQLGSLPNPTLFELLFEQNYSSSVVQQLQL
jgi:hypothetical protein